MAKFKVGDRIRVVRGNSLGPCQNGVEDVVTKLVFESGCDLIHGRKIGGVWLEFRFELVHSFTVDCVVRCDDSSGTDLKQGRLYCVNEITDGGALVLNLPGAKPYRHTRFSLSTKEELASQRRQEVAVAREALFTATGGFTASAPQPVAIALPANDPGWNISINGTSSSPVIACEPKQEATLPFKVGDRIVCIEGSPSDGLATGSVHTVRSIDIDLVYIGSRRDGFYHRRFKLDDTEPQKPTEPKFKAGDRVVCVIPRGTMIEKGCEYIVSKVFPNKKEYSRPEFGTGHCVELRGATSGDLSPCDEARFELATPFKAGDRVRCVNNETRLAGNRTLTIDAEYEIEEIFRGGVRLNVNRDIYDKDRFVRVKPKPNPFKVGDFVVCDDPSHSKSCFGGKLVQGGVYVVKIVAGGGIGVESHGSTYPTRGTEFWRHSRFSLYPGTMKHGPPPIAAAIKNAAISWSPSIFTAAGSGVPQTQFRCVNNSTPTNGFAPNDFEQLVSQQADAELRSQIDTSLLPAQTLAGMNHPAIQSAKHRLFNEKQHSHRAGKMAELREKIAVAKKNPYGVASLGRQRVAVGCIGANMFFPTSEEGYVKFHRQESLSS